MIEKQSTKHTNSEIVKQLIVLTQDHFDNQAPGDSPRTQAVIDETNLVSHISTAMSSYRRQRDRIADVYEDMKRIVEFKRID